MNKHITQYVRHTFQKCPQWRCCISNHINFVKQLEIHMICTGCKLYYFSYILQTEIAVSEFFAMAHQKQHKKIKNQHKKQKKQQVMRLITKVKSSYWRILATIIHKWSAQ